MSDIDLDYFEKILVRKAMTDGTYLASVADYVEPKYFNDKNISRYFEIVKKFYEEHDTLPTITEVKTYLTTDTLKKGFRTLVESFRELDSNLNNDELYINTEKFLKERGLYHAILESAESISGDGGDVGDIVEKFEKIAGINLNVDHGFELFADKDKMIHDLLNEESRISTGWAWLDEALGGGFLENGKALYMFAGQANIGKSIFLGNIAANIAEQNKTVLVITLEMSELMYAQRISSKITKIPMKDFKAEAPTLGHALDAKKRELPRAKIFIKEFPPSTITPQQLKAFIKKLIDSGEEIDAIVIDYLGLMAGPMGLNSHDRLKYISEQSRAMSYPQFFGCPVISAGQLNRDSYGTDNPGMDGLADSIALATVPDSLTSIYQNEEDREMGIIRCGMMKNRFGPMGMVQTMRIDYSTLTVTQSDEEESEMDEQELTLLETLSKL